MFGQTVGGQSRFPEDIYGQKINLVDFLKFVCPLSEIQSKIFHNVVCSSNAHNTPGWARPK